MGKFFAAVAVLALLALAGCAQQAPDSGADNSGNAAYRNISAQEFSEKLKSKDFFLLDVHIPEQAHIEGTDAFIPYNALEENSAKLPGDKSAPIVVYCRSGTMSIEASEKLAEMGYTNVLNVEGGLNAFNALQEGETSGAGKELSAAEKLLEKVAPSEGVVLPVKWNDVLVKTVDAGAIDLNEYKAALSSYGAELSPEHEKILLEGSDENISFTPENALFNLNMLWALGLVNKNPILTEGKISTYEERGSFASTGGWTLGAKPGGELLATATIIVLTPEQQALVEEVTENVFRPCCNNSTAFPDCNHGMAALALAELMASQGATREQIYDALLVANSYWFTQHYVNVAALLEQEGKSWESADAKELLGAQYSSYNGSVFVRKALKELPQIEGSASCAV